MIIPIPRLSPLHWTLVLVPLPIGALLAGLTAALAALGVLRRMP